MEHADISKSPRAVTAIAAVIALYATPAFAQDAQTASPAQSAPPITAPESLGTPATSAPPVALPETQASSPTVIVPPAASPAAPVAAPVIVLPDVTAPAEPQATPAASARTGTTERPAAPAPSAARAVSAPDDADAEAPRVEASPAVPTSAADGTAADGALAEGALPAGASAPADAAPAPDPAAVETEEAGDMTTTGVIGLLAALGIAGAGAFAMTRRRRSGRPLAEDEIDRRPEPAPRAPEAARIEPARPAPVVTPPATHASGPVRQPAPSPMLQGGPVPTDPQARRALLESMVAARPDEANPFTSRKARMRRARIQLQHREHLQKQQGDHFDWRTYKPSTVPSTPAAPEPVTA